jgi:hypothetical protein
MKQIHIPKMEIIYNIYTTKQYIQYIYIYILYILFCCINVKFYLLNYENQ